MKLLHLVSLLLIASFVHADVTYTASITNKGKTGQGAASALVTYIKGDLSRAEMADPTGKSGQTMVIITRLDKGVAWMLDAKNKTYTEINFAQLKALQKGSAADTIVPAIKVTKGGGNKKVLNMNCEKVTLAMDIKSGKGSTKYVQTMWVAKNVPGAKEIIDYQKKVVASGMGGSGGNTKAQQEFQKKVNDIGGLPLITDLDMKVEGGPMSMAIQTTIEITKIDTKPLNQSLFEIPAGYKTAK